MRFGVQCAAPRTKFSGTEISARPFLLRGEPDVSEINRGSLRILAPWWLTEREAGITKAGQGSIEKKEASLRKSDTFEEELRCYVRKWIEY